MDRVAPVAPIYLLQLPYNREQKHVLINNTPCNYEIINKYVVISKKNEFINRVPLFPSVLFSFCFDFL